MKLLFCKVCLYERRCYPSAKILFCSKCNAGVAYVEFKV